MSVPLPCPHPASLDALPCRTGESSPVGLAGEGISLVWWVWVHGEGSQSLVPWRAGPSTPAGTFISHSPPSSPEQKGERAGEQGGTGQCQSTRGSCELKDLFILQIRGFPLRCLHVLPVPCLAAHGAPGAAQWGHPQLRHHLPWGPPPQRDHPGRGPEGGWVQHRGYR